MIFYTLLFIDEKYQSLSQNIEKTDFFQQINTYIDCCTTLKSSLKKYNNEFQLIILTNNKQYINQYKPSLTVKELNFTLDIPTAVNFFAAHYKLEILKYLANNASNYSALIDNDMVCNSSIPCDLQNCIDHNIPTYYNITDQVSEAYGTQTIIKSKNVIGNFKSNGLWAGGEYIAGDKYFFKKLTSIISDIYPTYIDNIEKIHHQGDEMLVSTAIEKLLRSGQYIHDISKSQILKRFWSIKIKHKQMQLKHYKNYFLLHLPSDKRFLANINSRGFNFNHYINYYKRHKVKQILIELKNFLKNIFLKTK